MKIVRNLSRGRSPCQRVNHVKSGVIYFSAFIFSYDTIHVSGTIHTRDRDRDRDLTNSLWPHLSHVNWLLGFKKGTFASAMIEKLSKDRGELFT